MIKRVLSIGLVIWGIVQPFWLLPKEMDFACGEESRAQPVAGAIRMVKEELPSARIEVTGKGYPPKRNIQETQKRLLARRAAIVDAYRVMSATLNGVSGYIAGGEGIIQTSGFVKGAEVSDVRYFANGKVEVDLILPVTLRRGVGKKADWDSIVSDISRNGYSVYYTEKPGQITEEEWLEMRSEK